MTKKQVQIDEVKKRTKKKHLPRRKKSAIFSIKKVEYNFDMNNKNKAISARTS